MRLAVVGAVVAALLATIAVFAAGEMLTRPAHRPIGEPPVELHATTIHIPVASAGSIAGWFAPGSGRGAILLLHGVRSDRTQMVGRARFLHDAGYAVLLVDLPAHGESSGERITFGARESEGVTAALRFLRERVPDEPVGVIGVSLGAASLVLAHPLPPPCAVVLESMYPTIEDAVADRLQTRLGAFGPPLAPLLLWQLPLRTGIAPERLRPIDGIAALRAPVLIASGTDDRYTTWPETERIFAAAQSPKELWPMPKAGHVDLFAFDPAAYRARILAFFETQVRQDVSHRSAPSITGHGPRHEGLS